MSKEDSLLSAVISGDLYASLEQDRYLVSCTDTTYGTTPLHWACQKGHSQMVRMLISEFEADRNARDLYNNTPVHVAALNGKEEVVLTLIKEFGCDPTVRGRYDRSMLHQACNSGNVSLVKTLIRDFKADITARDDSKNMPIHACGCIYWARRSGVNPD